jgi:hypothetical protein
VPRGRPTGSLPMQADTGRRTRILSALSKCVGEAGSCFSGEGLCHGGEAKSSQHRLVLGEHLDDTDRLVLPLVSEHLSAAA